MTVPNFSNSSDQDSDIADSLHPTITEEESPDYIMSFDGEATYTPPPHIAARIYKSRSYHRKSSAASSRRNSIASHHSSRSERSGHGGPHSTHVAQHLRRASIIESRRAKAADRNAHAEKVRLRAALNKAAPRGPVDSEEKAIAAQQAREKYLAQVRANCAAEVQRSKRIAEEHREKKAAEYQKMKADMAERHAQAERRRALLEQNQRRPRTAQSSDEATSKKTGYAWRPRNEGEAATILQATWRKRQRRTIVREFLHFGLSVESAREQPFDEIGQRLNQQEVIESAAKVMQILGMSKARDSVGQQAAPKRLLTTFLVLGQPTLVVNRNTEQEQNIIRTSQQLLMRLNQVFDLIRTGHVLDEKIATDRLNEAHGEFEAAFTAWRSQDSQLLVTSMVAQFVELDNIWQSVKEDTAEEVTEDYKQGIRHNQTLIIQRLKKLAGPERAMKLIKEGIRKTRKDRAKKRASEANIPRLAAEAASSSLPAAQAPITRQTPNGRQAAVQRLQASSMVPENRTINHELAINRKWTIDVDTMEKKRDEIIEETASQLQKGLDAGMHEVWIPALAESLLQKLSTILPPDKPTFATIKDVLDPQMVAQQVRNGTFSYPNFFSFMNTILPKLCAPVRDDEVKALAQSPSEDPVKQMARIYFIVELMVLDMLNFQLISIAPELLKESAGYESRSFARSLNNEIPSRTLEWWKRSKSSALEEAAKRTPDSNPAHRLTAHKIYMQGLVDLTLAIEPLAPESIPETLNLDTSRLTRFRTETLRLITISAILLNAKSLLRRDTRSNWKAEAARMWDVPLSSSPATFVQIVESRYALPPTTKAQLTTFVTRILAEAKESRANNAVMRVMLRKLRTQVLSRLQAGSEEERTKLSQGASDMLGSAGMMEFVGRIGEWVGELGRVADVDRESHAEWYDRVVEIVEKEE